MRYDRVQTCDEDSQQQQEQQPLDSQRPRTSSFFRRASFHILCFTNAAISNSPFHSSSDSNDGNDSSNRPQSPSPLPTTQLRQNHGNNGEHHRICSNSSESSRSTSRSRSLRAVSHQSAHVRLFRLVWCLALLAGEHGTFWAMIHRCSWPEHASWDQSTEGGKERYRIAIIADPQLTDWYSYNQTGLLLKLVETYTDIYMKRSFHRLHTSLRPDAVLFLGDLNDGGRDSEQEVFDKNERRFYEHVFETGISAWNQQPVVMDDTTQGESWPQGQSEENINITGHYRQRVDIPLDANERQAIRNSGKSARLYVAGNHDIGFGDTLIRSSMRRFKQEFGSVNYKVQVGNHSLIVLDTLALSSHVPAIREESQRFLNELEEEKQLLPRILFTHVPLFRLDTTPCGAARETKQLIINRGGIQYWNMVNASLSREILRGVQPDMVFSGDDHDWCEIVHSLDGNLTPEVTLPTFSFAQGIQQPGFVMLSLYNPNLKVKNAFPMVPSDIGLPTSTGDGPRSVARPSENSTFVYEECMLPNQIMIYLCYGLMFAISLNWILIYRYHWMSTWGRHQRTDRSILVPWRNASSQTPTSAPLLTSTMQPQDQQLQGQCYDDADGQIENVSSYPLESEFIEDATTKLKRNRRFWPVRTGLYWWMVVWDLWNIARYIIPLYIFQFIVSII